MLIKNNKKSFLINYLTLTQVIKNYNNQIIKFTLFFLFFLF
jgi:hypothetical protein